MALRKELSLALLFLLVVFTGCLILFQIQKVDQPMILASYGESSMHLQQMEEGRDFFGQLEIPLYYVTGIEDRRQVTEVFLETPEGMDAELLGRPFFGGGNFYDEEPGMVFGRYRLVQVVVSLTYIGESPFDQAILQGAKVLLEDGQTLEGGFGSWIVEGKTYEEMPLDHWQSSGSNVGVSSLLYRVKETIVLEGIESHFQDILEDRYEVKVNGLEMDQIQGLTLSAGENLRIESRFLEVEEGTLDRYFLRPRLSFTDLQGNTYGMALSGMEDYDFPHRTFDPWILTKAFWERRGGHES